MNNAKKILITLTLIVLLGGVLRFYNLGEVSFVADEFLDVNATYGYSQTGEWKAWDFNLEQPAERINDPSDQRAWMYRWQVAKLFNYFEPTEVVARSVSAVWGIVTIILIYFVAKYFTGKKYIGLISAFLFAVSIVGIIFDRKLRMYAMFFPVFLAFSWIFYRFFEEDYKGKIELFKKINNAWGLNLAYFAPAVVLGLLSLHLHQLTASIGIIFVVYVFLRLIITYRNNKDLNPTSHKLRGASKYFTSLALIITVFIIGKLTSLQPIEQLSGTFKLFNDNFSYFSKIFADYSHPIIAVIFFILGIYYICKVQKKEKEATWMAVSFLVTLLMAVFIWRRSAGPQYIFFIQSFEIILIASGVYYAAKFFKDNFSKFGKKAFYATIILSLLILPNYAYFFEDNNTYRQNSRSESPRYRMIFEYFKKKKADADVLITRDFRNYYWHGEKIKTFDFGGEVSKNKLTPEKLQQIINEHPSGWVIYSDNDESYISNKAENYIENNMEKINAIPVRGKVSVYRWGTEE